ncbi:DNA-directed RNA polymerase subunit alpha [Candidatus Hodgkinia cicadicola]|nr:DNA-directed RNA polymerase subunit alpha [Candidatus Hodgkinia cicadicola]
MQTAKSQKSITMAGLNVIMHTCGRNCVNVELVPLFRGMGQTVANSLRRVLLTCVSGWALVGVYIDGAEHELSRLNGVKEDVIDIILNLKQLVFGGDSNANIVKGVLFANSEGNVLARNVCIPGNVRVFNVNQQICYLNFNSRIRIELVIARGIGYLCSDDLRSMLGVCLRDFIALDANFSPIKRVSYNVVESEYSFAGYDKINMLVESNGTIDFNETIGTCCELIGYQFSSLAEAFR